MAVLVVLTCITPAAWAAGHSSDYLEPLDREMFSRFYDVLLSYFSVTPFDCGRGIVANSSNPEYSISVYSTSQRGESTRYHATYIAADSNLWQETNRGYDPEKARNVKMRRLDAEFPQRTAILLKDAWRGMLIMPYHPKARSVSVEGPVVLDGAVELFSIERLNAPPVAGQLIVPVKLEGRKTDRLVLLTNLIADYCKAKVIDRPRIVKRIDQEASLLLRSLKAKN